MMDRLKSLEIFKAIADHGSFARGAEAMDLPKSVTTRAIQELEAVLGVRLLHRTTRRIALTSVGEDVLQRARVLLAGFDELAASSSLSALEAHGPVRLVAPAPYGAWRLGPALASFSQLHTRVQVELRTTENEIDLLQGRADLGIYVGVSPPLEMVAMRIGYEPVGIYAAAAYLARRGCPLQPEDLQQHDDLSYDGAAAAGPWRLRQGDGLWTEALPPRKVLSSNNAETLVCAASHGAGLVRLPSFMVERSLALGELKPVLETWASEPVGVHLAYVSRRYQPLAVRRLIDHLVASLSVPDTAQRLSRAPGQPLHLAAPSSLRLIASHLRVGPAASALADGAVGALSLTRVHRPASTLS